MEKDWLKEHYQEETGILDLSFSGLTSLPDSIRELKGLKILDLSGLNLKELPDWLPDLGLPFSREPDGDGVRLYETTVEGIDMVIFDQPYEVVAEWFRVRRQSHVQPLNEIKVVFLGDGESGKSHTIARLLNDGNNPMDYWDVSTPGIVIKSKEYDLDGRRVRVNYWDFGGQEIMHSMHRIFLTDRTMYVVMLNARDDTQDERARYWLHNIKAFAPNAPVLLVLNKIDQNHRASIDERTLRARYPGLKAILRLSALKYSREEFNSSFTSVLLDEIRKTGYLDVQWPTSWKRVKQALEMMPQAYIMGDEYLRICEACNLYESQKDLLHWFNDLGISFCLSNEEDYALEDYVILRPDWITNAIYILLFNEIEGANNGLVPHSSIYRLLRNAHDGSRIRKTLPNAYYTISDIQYVLGIMRKFGLSFTDGQDSEFIPMLCRQKAAVDIWEYEQDPDTLEFRMEFEYLPDNLLHRLMVERHADLDLSRVWRAGAVFRLPALELSAVVAIDGNLLCFYVRADSKNHSPSTYLSMLQESVEGIRRQMGLEEPINLIIYKIKGERDSFPYEELTAAMEAGHTAVYSRAFRRMVPISAILGEEDSQVKQKKDRLIAQVAKACISLQEEPFSINANEAQRTTWIQDYLRAQGYTVHDQMRRSLADVNIRSEELDILICDQNNRQLAVCEALNVKGKQDVRIWNDHLAKMLTNYMTSELPTQLLISFVECNVREYHKLWSSYNDHMRKYKPQYGKRMGEYQHVLPLPELPEYLRVAQCTYDIGGTAVTVYHYFVYMGPIDQMDTPVEFEQRMRLEQAQVEIAMLQSELTQLKVKSETELIDRNQLELMLHDSKEEIENLTAALAHTQNEVENALAESEQANAKAEMYAVEIEILRSDKEQLNAELLVMRNAIDHNQILLSEAEYAARVAEENRKRIEAEHRKLLDELNRLNAEIAAQHVRFQKLSEEQNLKNDEKAATIAELIGHLEQKKQELDKVEAAAKIAVKKQKEYEDLVAELERRHQALQMATAHAESAKSARQELEKLYADSKRRQLAAQESAVAAQRENALLAEKLVEQTRQIQSLEEALREAQSKVTDEAEEEDDGQPEEDEDGVLITKEYRVIILGDSEAGKSQILHRLRYPKRDPKKFSGDVTPGIDIASRVLDTNAGRVRVNFWDFGGQEILYSMHRLFLTKNTLYVIVLNTRNDNQDEQAKFWLHYVELYATGAPVILVLNKVDQNPDAALNKRALMRKFRYTADIKDVLKLSAKIASNDEFNDGFVEKIRGWIESENAQNKENSFTVEELSICNEVRSQCEGQQIMEMSRFFEICEDGNLPENTEFEELAKRFNKAGMLVYFGTRTNLIMSPDWITDAIYQILEKGAAYAANGVIENKVIERILYKDKQKSFNKYLVDFVRNMMREKGLSFPYPNQDRLFIPALCTREEPAAAEAFMSATDTIHMQMLFRYLPTGVLHQLMVDLCDDLDNQMVWLSGALFMNDVGCKALVIREKDRMCICVRGENRVLTLRYLENLRSRIEGIARGDMYKAHVQETLLGYYIMDRGEVEFFDYDRLTKSKEYDLNYTMSKIKPGAVVVRDILDQRDGSYIQERDTLLQLVLRGCVAIQKEPKFSASEADENDRNREIARMIQAALTPKDQTQGGHSGTGDGIGELDIEILNDRKVPIAILEALNTTSINTSYWREHLNKLVDNYNSSGLRYLILTSYVSGKKSKFLEKFKETAAHWKKVEPKGLEGCLEGVDTLVMDDCPELIRITRADYVRNNFKVSVYHFLVYIGGEEDTAANA